MSASARPIASRWPHQRHRPRARRARHTRDVQVRVSHFLNVPPLIASTDLVAALSRRIAEPFARMLPLRLFEPPLKLRHSRIAMAWHASLDEDPAQRWLRDQVATVAAAV